MARISQWASRSLNAIAAIAFVAAAIAIGSNSAARADMPPQLATPHVAVNHAGVAAAGHDVVAFFLVGQALKGDRNITATHDGATYWFVSEENRAVFLTDPAALAPQYGGYGAYGVRVGRKIKPGAPLTWRVHDEKLFVFIDADTKQMWMADEENSLRIANTIWAKIRAVPTALLETPATN